MSVREAARIKGVSYSATLRAIRSGRLPSRRVGRTLLIATTDLDQWHPADRSTAGPGASPPMPPADAGTLRERVSALARIFGATDDPLPSLLGRLMLVLGADDGAVWTLSTDGRTLRRAAAAGEPAGRDDPDVTLDRGDLSALAILRPGPTTVGPDHLVARLGGGWPGAIVIPIRGDDRLLAVVGLGRLGDLRPRSADDDVWLDALIGMMTAVMVRRSRADLATHRLHELRQVAEAAADPLAIVDGSGRIQIANARLRSRFGLVSGALEIGVELPTLLGQVEVLSGTGGKRSVVPRFRATLAGQEATVLPLSVPDPTGSGIGRMIVTPIPPRPVVLPGVTPESPVDDDRPRSWLVRLGPAGAPADAVGPRSEPVRPTGMVEIDLLLELVGALGAATTLDEVARVAVDEIRPVIDASAGSVMLLGDDGLLYRQTPSGFSDAHMMETVFAPAAITAVATAMRERRAVLFRRSTADALETIALDRAGSDGALVIPLLDGDDVIGAMGMAFFAEPTALAEPELSLATALGRYVALAFRRVRGLQP